ncbi:MAG TPA: hypothetical protein VEJ63_15890 [Planctomycetota bacterium]|nr:hypothetical protein [Planctomycetota bacterium]
MADATRRSTRFSMRSKQLGQLLMENGDVQADQVAKALKIQEQQGGMIGLIMREQGFCDENAIAAALLKQVQVTDVRCEELGVAPEVAQLVARETCETEKLCPFERLGNLLCVVMGNPLNRRAITQIEESTHLKVKSFKSVWPKINELIQRTYSEENLAAGGAEGINEADATISDVSLGQGEEGAVLTDAPALEDAQPPLQLDEAQPPIEVGDLEPSAPAAAVAPAVRAPAAKRQTQPAKPAEPKIQGIDNLNEDQAEVIATDRRGLIKRRPVADDEPVKPKPEKRAKVNVDLDALDLSKGEVVRHADDAPEGMEEIEYTPFDNKPLQRHAGEIVALTMVPDGYFYSDSKAPGRKRSDELLAVIDGLPLAETVAQSIGEYEAKEAEKKKAAAPKPVEKPVLKQSPAAVAAMAARPLELQPAPADVMTAILISEVEFQRLTGHMAEDPIGEWDWHFAAQGPVPVLSYEEQ